MKRPLSTKERVETEIIDKRFWVHFFENMENRGNIESK